MKYESTNCEQRTKTETAACDPVREPSVCRASLLASLLFAVIIATIVIASVTSFAEGLAVVLLMLAACTDLMRGKIPNALTYSAVPLGFGLSLAVFVMPASTVASVLGCPPLPHAALAFVLVAAVGLTGLLIGAWGGGDAKLVAALSPLLGLVGTCSLVVLGLVATIAIYSLHQVTKGKMLDYAQDLLVRVLGNFGWPSRGIVRVRGRLVPLAPGFLIAFFAAHACGGLTQLWAVPQ